MFHKKQQGFSIVSAVFLIVVLALLATGMIKILSISQQSISQENTSIKAYMAARSGLQIAMYQAIYAAPANGVIHNLTYTNGGLAITTAQITFVRSVVDTNVYYQINALADYAALGNPEHAQRELKLRFQPNI